MSKHGKLSSLWLCLLGLAVPIGGMILFTLISRFFTFNVRYTIAAYPYFCIPVGTAIAFLLRKHVGLGAIAGLALVGLSAVSFTNYFGQPQ